MYRDDDERQAYDRWHRYGRERGWMDKAKDEVKSWFGDDEAERRRREDTRDDRRDDVRERGRDYGYESEPRYSRRNEESRYGRNDWSRRSPFGMDEESRRDYGRDRDREREYGGYSSFGRGSSYRSEYERPHWESEGFNPYYENRGGRGREEYLGREYGTGSYGGTYGGGSGMYGGPGYGAGGAQYGGGGLGSSLYNHAGRGSKTYQRSDERIKDEVHERLARHPAIDAGEIDVQAQGGEVTLSGNVTTRYEKRLAEELAEEVFGVRNVQNSIRVGREMGQSSTVADGQPANRTPLRR
jgi:osmotically-inducible protein OsmY